MRRANLLACDYGSNFLATVNGPDVYVYSGDEERPLWKHTHPTPVVGVCVTDEEIITLDEAGRLAWWDGVSGEVADEASIEGKPRALAVDSDGVAAVLTKAGVEIVDPGDEGQLLKIAQGRCLAWSDDGERLAVGTRDGAVVVFDVEGAEQLGSVELDEAITSLCWSSEGEWLVTAGSTVYSVLEDGSAAEELGAVRGKQPDCIACSADGGFVALRADAEVLAFALPGLEKLGSITVEDRKIVGLGFGARAWLWVGLDQGDASKVSLRTGAIKRTEPHEEEDARTWKLSADLPGVEGRRRAKGRGRTAEVSRRPRSEKAMNTPDLQTLLMLGSIALATGVMWGSAKFYCNNHSAISLKPREVGTVELASTPKDAAIEMIYRLSTYRFDRALELTDGEASAAVEKALQGCEQEGQKACDAKRAQAKKDEVLATAELLTSTAGKARARVTTYRDGKQEAIYDVDLKESSPIWKIVKFEKTG